MKTNLISSMILGFLFISMLPDASIDGKYIYKKTKHFEKVSSISKRCFSCTAQVTNFTLVSDVGGSITFSWSYTGSPASFNYGGYYNESGGGHYSGNTTSTTLTIPDGGFDGGRIGVVAVCSDGTEVGDTHGVLWYDYQAEEYF